MSIFPPEDSGYPGPPDVLGYIFAPRKSTRKLPTRSRATRESDIRGYLRANPSATREQARKRTGDLRRRGYIPEVIRSERATPEQSASAQRYSEQSRRSQEAAERKRQQIGGGGIGRVAYVDDEQVYQYLYDSFSYTHGYRFVHDQLGPNENPWLDWNEQVVRFNIAQASIAEKEQWLNTDPFDLMRQAVEANRTGQFSNLFYHSDFNQGV